MRANYVPVDATGAWRTRIATAMTYYARRPGEDRDAADRERQAARAERAALGPAPADRERGDSQAPAPQGTREPKALGRWFYTAEGERLPLREAQDRLLAEVEGHRDRARQEREAAAAQRREARTARSEARLQAFVGHARDDADRGRREALAARWRHAREARERLPDPAFRVYRVVLSTSWAVLDGKDVQHVLGTALGGAAGAVVGSVAHAAVVSYRDAQRHARGLTRAVEREHEASRRREQQREARQAARDARRAERAQLRARERADQRFAARFLYVRHEGPSHSHPHVHALLVTDGRGLDRRDLGRMRAALAEREALREREQAHTRQQQTQHTQHHEQHQRAHGAAQEAGR